MKIFLEQKKHLAALACNFGIVVMEIVGLFLSVERHGLKVFQFYTENSNYFALIVSSMFCVQCIFSLIRKKKNSSVDGYH